MDITVWLTGNSSLNICTHYFFASEKESAKRVGMRIALTCLSCSCAREKGKIPFSSLPIYSRILSIYTPVGGKGGVGGLGETFPTHLLTLLPLKNGTKQQPGYFPENEASERGKVAIVISKNLSSWWYEAVNIKGAPKP